MNKPNDCPHCASDDLEVFEVQASSITFAVRRKDAALKTAASEQRSEARDLRMESARGKADRREVG